MIFDFFSLPCLLHRQFEKAVTPENPKFEGNMSNNRLEVASDFVDSSKSALTFT